MNNTNTTLWRTKDHLYLAPLVFIFFYQHFLDSFAHFSLNYKFDCIYFCPFSFKL